MGGIMNLNLTFTTQFIKKIAFSFARAFLGIFIAGISGIGQDFLSTHDWNTLKSALLALVVAGIIAGFRALQHVFLDDPDIPAQPTKLAPKKRRARRKQTKVT
jgi:hypothetical protein